MSCDAQPKPAAEKDWGCYLLVSSYSLVSSIFQSLLVKCELNTKTSIFIRISTFDSQTWHPTENMKIDSAVSRVSVPPSPNTARESNPTAGPTNATLCVSFRALVSPVRDESESHRTPARTPPRAPAAAKLEYIHARGDNSRFAAGVSGKARTGQVNG